MRDTIEQCFDCIVCGEEWTTEHYISDYEDDPLLTNNICVMCGGTMRDALQNKIEYEQATKLELIHYILKRVINKTLLKIRLK